MLGMQFAIGAANDLADARLDAMAKPRKPIPAGLVPPRTTLAVCVASAALGLLAAATAGPAALLIGVAGLADGLSYDLWFKKTPFAWMPFAAGVGLLPLYAWWGARGALPISILAVAGVAVLAGAALALANAYADIDGDRRSGVDSVAIMLGARLTLGLNALLLVSVQAIAIATTLTLGSAPGALAGEVVGAGLGWLALGFAALRWNRIRPLVWEVQAVAFLVLGASWLAALSAAGALRG
jgi:4-hydroxybenzoate polyprenyltransferase